MSLKLPPPLGTKPRWDKYDGYMGNFRASLADDIDLYTESNQVLAVGLNSDGAIVVGSGQTGIVGLMIIAVGIDSYGNLLEGGINTQAGDANDVGKHGEITNFIPSAITNNWAVTVTADSGNVTVNTVSPTFIDSLTNRTSGGDTNASGAFAYNGIASALKTAIVAADDDLLASDVTVTGTAPNFVVTLPDGWELTAGTGVTVAEAVSLTPLAGTAYFGHADGSVTAVKGSDGVYVGHTVEASRLIVNVDDYHS